MATKTTKLIFSALAPLLALIVLSIAATPALAAGANSAHGYIRALGTGSGSEAGQLELAAPFRYEPWVFTGRPAPVTIAGSGAAVNDATHDVYVADTGNHRVDEFEANGEFVRAFGKNVGGPGIDTCTLIAGCRAGAVGSEPGALEAPRFVAVDNSTNPLDSSKGDVYVGDGVGKEAQNEVQFVEINDATSGTFTLTFEGETTAPISYDKSAYDASEPGAGQNAQAADKALEKLAKVGAGNVHAVERGDEGETRGLEVEFIGALAETALPPLGCDPSALTPAGASCQLTVGQEGSHFAGETISKFNSDGELEAGWGDSTPTLNGQLTGKNASAGSFAGKLDGIAVDRANGDLWILNTGGVSRQAVLYKFGEAGTFIENQNVPAPAGGGGVEASGIAIDGEGKLITAPRGDTGVALDTVTGGLYFDLGDSLQQVTPAEEFGPPQLQGGAGVAVDSSSGEPPFSGTVYAANTVSDQVDVFPVLLEVETGVASAITATTMTLSGKVNPEASEVGECYFEYGTSSEYEHDAPCEQTPAEIGKGASSVSVSAKVSGLLVGTTYHFRLVATKGTTAVPGDDAQASTPPGPVLSGGEATEVTAAGARLNALLDPEGLPVTRCRFEYGTSTTYTTAVPCEQKLAQLGTGTQPVPVSAQLTGLSPNTTYYWRLSVRDENGEAYEPGHTFVYPTTGTELPDGREYELVSPASKNGASLGNNFFGVRYAFARDGSRVIAQSIQCFAEAQSCTGVRSADTSEGEPFEFARTDQPQQCAPAVPPCWATMALAPPASEFGSDSTWSFGPDQGMALFSMPTPPGGEDDWYARSSEGSFQDLGPLSSPSLGRSLFTGSEPILPLAATADFSHLVWSANKTGGGGPEWSFPGAPGGQVVEYAGAGNTQPFLVGVSGPRGSTASIGGCETELGASGGSASNSDALSADGRTVYFTACESGLYARVDGETPEAHTVAVSQPQCGGEPECLADEAHPSAAYFEGASADGSTAFFLDTQELTPTATEGTGTARSSGCGKGSGTDCNLYESRCTSECERAGEQRTLIDVSAGSPTPEVLGVVATSADGSHVYFVANGALVGGVRGGTCRYSGNNNNPVVGRCNLYVYERDERYPDGHTAFIATVPATDYEQWKGLNLPYIYANVTPEGRFLVFESHGDLTPDDTAKSGYTQIFRYDADPTVEEAAEHVPPLVRVSIGNDGFDDDGNAGVGAASIVPAIVGVQQAGPARGDPTMSDDGSRVFFQSPIQLTPQAPKSDTVIGEERGEAIYAQGVYEWESEGVGGCPAGRGAGCVYLISDGRDVSLTTTACGGAQLRTAGFESAVCLLGADVEGKNVFFTTADRLVPADTNPQQVNIYDARICEPEHGNPCVSEPAPPLPPCDGENCHGVPPQRAPLLTGGSETFNGKGNLTGGRELNPPAVKPKSLTKAQKLSGALKSCKKDKNKKKRATCEKQAKKKYGAAKKSSKKKGK